MSNFLSEEDLYYQQSKMIISQQDQQAECISTSQSSCNDQATTLSKNDKKNKCASKLKNFKQTTNEDFKQVQFVIRPIQNTQNFQIEIYRGLQITSDGVIRHFLSIYQVCFGFNQYESFQIQDFSINYGLINIKQQSKQNLVLNGHQYALQFLHHIPNIQHQLVKEIFNFCESNLEQLVSYYSKQDTSEFLFEQKEEEFKRFQQMCMLFLQQLNHNNNQMFTYQITRLSQKHNGFDLQNYGFSKSYLDLLGIDSETLSQIILRGKQIDLLSKKVDITNQSLYFMQNFLREESICHSSEVVTFDGYSIKLLFKTKNYSKLFPNSEILEGFNEYYFLVTEIDVDMHDLNQLILYRQSIASKSKLSYEDFIRKELSYQFEDVEYSIHSQAFLEKYYDLNIENLKQKQQLQSSYRVISI